MLALGSHAVCVESGWQTLKSSQQSSLPNKPVVTTTTVLTVIVQDGGPQQESESEVLSHESDVMSPT